MAGATTQPDSTLCFRVELTYLDIVRALAWQQWQRWYGKLLLLLLPVLFVGGLVSGITTGRWNGFALLVPVLYGLYLAFVAWQGWLQLGAGGQQLTYTLTPEGIDITNGQQAGLLRWANVVGAVESSFAFVVLLSGGRFALIPKGRLSREQTVALGQLLHQYLHNRARLQAQH